MKLENIPFQCVDWSALAPTKHAGETAASASWRTQITGEVRSRIVEYEPGYVADHWCERGHVVFVIDGELITELKDKPISSSPLSIGLPSQPALRAGPTPSGEAVAALMGLGVAEAAARRVVEQAAERLGEEANEAALIKAALQELGR